MSWQKLLRSVFEDAEMPLSQIIVVIPIPVGQEFEETLRLLVQLAEWDQAIVDVLSFQDDGVPEVMMFRSREVKERVQTDGIDDDTDRDVIHAVVDNQAGFILLNTSYEEEIVYS